MKANHSTHKESNFGSLPKSSSVYAIDSREAISDVTSRAERRSPVVSEQRTHLVGESANPPNKPSPYNDVLPAWTISSMRGGHAASSGFGAR
jgi:hypothetical protein